MVGVLNWTPLFLPHESDEFRFIFRRGINGCAQSKRHVTALCTFAAAEVSACAVFSERKPSPAPPDNITSFIMLLRRGRTPHA